MSFKILNNFFNNFLNTKKLLLFFCFLLLLTFSCKEEEKGSFTCSNGKAIEGTPNGKDDVEKCDSCDATYHIEDGVCVANVYTCANGTERTEDRPEMHNQQYCESCEGEYTLNESTKLCDGNSYTCENGTPEDGMPDMTEDKEDCAMCLGGFVLINDKTCEAGEFTCMNGKAKGGEPDGNANEERCISCNPGRYIDTTTLSCLENQYTCSNGTAFGNGTPGGQNGFPYCAGCNPGYVLEVPRSVSELGIIISFCRRAIHICNDGVLNDSLPTPEITGNLDVQRCKSCVTTPIPYILIGGTCYRDFDSDGTVDIHDIDDDNDGLIEIHNLDMLYNIRHNLDGTSYINTSGGTGNTSAAPTSATSDCKTATDGVYLCGYELNRSLDFANTSDYADGVINDSWRPTGGDPNTAENVGWQGIGPNTGSSTNGFNAIFEGNGQTISNLYQHLRSTGSTNNHAGFFNIIAPGSTIRNVGITSATSIHTKLDGTADAAIGILVGVSNGTIINSYTTGIVNGGARDEWIGGLVGTTQDCGEYANCPIISSYTDVTINGSGGIDHIGGLVGIISNTRIIANYTKGKIDGGDGVDEIGGLIGECINPQSLIVASYSTIQINGSAGNDLVGGLIGNTSTGPIVIASYAMGNVSGYIGNDIVGGLVGRSVNLVILSSYATGDANGDAGDDNVGGIAGFIIPTSLAGDAGIYGITASYAIGNVDGGEGNDNVGKLFGVYDSMDNNLISHSYGFGIVTGENVYNEPRESEFTASSAEVLVLGTEDDSTDVNVSRLWNDKNTRSLNAWDFGNTSQIPALRYSEYDGTSGTTVYCDLFTNVVLPDGSSVVCGTTLIPGQRD